MNTISILKTVVTACLVLSLAFPLQAGPTIVQDNRVTNLSATPVLGRGYSLATNTFQSTCMAKIVTTEPTYDFTYRFEDMEDFINATGNDENQLLKLANSSFRNYLIKAEKESRPVASRPRPGTEETFEGTVTRNTRKIVVNINLDSYYASVDESQTKLSPSATKLIQSQDLPGFFSSCGTYYIRSIRRNAVFISVFEFESMSTQEDRSFVYTLETELKGFRKEIVPEKESTTATSSSKTTETAPAETTEAVTEEEPAAEAEKTISFSQMASKRNLTITASAFGLGKNEKATLISYDIESFKNAIKDAFLSMQNPKTGKVTAIEVVPWSENTEFQVLLGLDKKSTVAEVTIGNRKIKAPLNLYEKKNNLNQNAELLAEIERSDRALMNIYYKAKICRKYIDTNWKRLEGGQRVFKGQYENRWVMNNRTNSEGVPLADLDAALSRQKINDLLLNHRRFMYGGGDWGNGASSCISTLMNTGFYVVNHNQIEACALLKENLVQIEDEIIENHCMPVLFNKGVEPAQTASQTQSQRPQNQ